VRPREAKETPNSKKNSKQFSLRKIESFSDVSFSQTEGENLKKVKTSKRSNFFTIFGTEGGMMNCFG
jgi:hypothetical protein